MFDLIINEVTHRFNLGDKAGPLTEVLVNAMTNPETQGVSGFIDRFKDNGLDYLVHSWLHTDAPLSINHAQIENVLGDKGGVLETVTSQLGLDKGSALLGLAYLIPKLLGQLAPAGNISDVMSPDAQPALSLTDSVAETAATVVAIPNHDTLASIVETVGHRFNLGGKAEPLVQSVVAAMTNSETGGLTGFIDLLKNEGLSGLVDSWLHGSAPLNINHAQIENALGAKDGLLETITSKVGLDKGSALISLSYLLPKLLYKLAPAGDSIAADASETSYFAEKGLALLGIGAMATGSSELNQSASPSVDEPIPALEAVPVPELSPTPEPILEAEQEPVSVSEPMSAPEAVPVPEELSSTPELILEAEPAPVSVSAPMPASEAVPVPEELSSTPEPILEAESAPVSVSEPMPALEAVPVPEELSSTPEPILEAEPAIVSVSEPMPVVEPAPVPEDLSPISEPILETEPEIVSVSESVPTPAALGEPVTAISSETKEGSPFWKNLFWILPIVLALLALKNCSHATEDNNTTTSNSSSGSGSAATLSAVNTESDQKTATKASTEKVVTAPVAKSQSTSVATQSKAAAAAKPKASTDKVSETVKSTTATAMSSIPSAKLYFDVDKALLPQDTADKLAPILKYLKAHSDAKVSIAGFHDPSGSQAANEDLAKNRAKQVMAKLKDAGIAEKSIVMQKPQTTTGTGTKAEARRVEVSINP